MRINKLTKEQENKIPEYINKWVTQASIPMDEKRAIVLVNKMYSKMDQKEPLIIIGDSPLNTCLLASLFFSLFRKSKHKNINNQLRDQLCAQLRAQLRDQLRDQLRAQLDDQLDDQLEAQLRDQLEAQLYDQLGDQLCDQLCDQLEDQLGTQLHTQLRTQLDDQLRTHLRTHLKKINSDCYLSIWWLVWCGWYEYGKMIGVNFDKEKYELFINFNSEINFIIPYENVCFISRKPTRITWKNKVLHSEEGGAVVYKDGYSMYMLNGIRMKKEHIETPAEKLDVQEIIKEPNVDVRRELIRKIGIERFILKAGAKVLDKKGEYEVISIKLSDEIPDARYLKMKNPSIGIFHVEGIEAECDTVEKAINWRAGNIKEKWEPSILT